MYPPLPRRERQIRCPKCDKLFWKSNHLKKHLNSHEGRRDYICEKCNKAFLTKYHLTRHLKICKGPKTAGKTLQEEEEEDDDEEEEDEDDEEDGDVGGLIDPVSREDRTLEPAEYASDKALSPLPWPPRGTAGLVGQPKTSYLFHPFL